MRIASTAALLLATLLLPIPNVAQQTSPEPATQRDPQALAVVQNSIAAMGGAAAAAQVTDTVVTGSIAPSTGSSIKGGAFVWKTAGSDFRYEKQGNASNQAFVSGHGRPTSIRNGAVTAFEPHIALASPPLHLPVVVLARVVANQDYAVTFLGRAEVNGAPAIKVHISLETDPISALVSPQDWYFDALSGLPLRVEHRFPDNRRPENFVSAAEDFSDFRIVAGLLVPFRITSHENGAPVAVATVMTVTFNNNLSPTEFDAPAGGAQ